MDMHMQTSATVGGLALVTIPNGLSSRTTIDTTSSSSTVPGVGMVSGRLIKRLGEIAIGVPENILIRWRLSSIERVIHTQPSSYWHPSNKGAQEIIEDLRDFLSDDKEQVRKRAFSLIQLLGDRDTVKDLAIQQQLSDIFTLYPPPADQSRFGQRAASSVTTNVRERNVGQVSIMEAVSIVKDAADMLPVPAVNAISATILSMLAITETMQQKKDDCKDLFASVIEFYSIVRDVQEGSANLSSSFLLHCNQLLQTLEKMITSIEKITRMGSISASLNASAIEREIRQHKEKLQGLKERFMMLLVVNSQSFNQHRVAERHTDMELDVNRALQVGTLEPSRQVRSIDQVVASTTPDRASLLISNFAGTVQNKDECKDLFASIIEFYGIITNVLEGYPSLPSSFVYHCDQLLRTLQEMSASVKEISHMGYISASLKASTIKREITQHKEKLQKLRERFMMLLIVNIQPFNQDRRVEQHGRPELDGNSDAGLAQ